MLARFATRTNKLERVMQHIRAKKQLKSLLEWEKKFFANCDDFPGKKEEKKFEKSNSTHLLIGRGEALFAELVYHLRHANHIAGSIFDRHAEESFGPVAGLNVHLAVEALILEERKRKPRETEVVVIKKRSDAAIQP
jgi:hypothetical protein